MCGPLDAVRLAHHTLGKKVEEKENMHNIQLDLGQNGPAHIRLSRLSNIKYVYLVK